MVMIALVKKDGDKAMLFGSEIQKQPMAR